MVEPATHSNVMEGGIYDSWVIAYLTRAERAER